MSTAEIGAERSFSCDACRRRFKWKPELAGLKVKCKCGEKIRVPVVMTEPGQPAVRPVTPPLTPSAAALPPRLPPKPAEKPPEEDTYDFADLGDVESSGKRVPDEPVLREPAHLSNSSPKGYTPLHVPQKQGGFLAGLKDKAAAAGTAWGYVYSFGSIAVGVVVLIVCFLLGLQHDAFMKRAQQVTATITGEPSVSKSGKGSRRNNPENWTFSFPVRYSVDGREFSNEVSIKGESHLPDGLHSENFSDWNGSTLNVYFDPADPNEVESGYAAEHSSYLYGYLVGAFFIGGGAWRLVRMRAA